LLVLHHLAKEIRLDECLGPFADELLILICYQDEPKCAMNRSWHDHEE
jgi:hypothetical protein